MFEKGDVQYASVIIVSDAYRPARRDLAPLKHAEFFFSIFKSIAPSLLARPGT